MFRKLGRRFRMLFRRRQYDADLDEEMRLHRELRAREEIERGLSPQDAHYAAQRRFGNDLLLREQSRDMWGWNWLTDFLQDLRYGLRMLRKNPGFTVVAVLTLALGIGATAAIFTVVNGVLLRPLPYPHPDELVYVQEILNNYPVSPFAGSREFAAWKNGSRTLSQVGAYMFTWFNLTGEGDAEHVLSGMASASFFSLLGAHPMLGRLFLPEEDRLGAPPVAILSEALWRSRYKADPAIVGKGITLDGKLYTVVGVLPSTFVIPDRMPAQYVLWVPLVLSPAGTPFHVVRIVGRLKSGVSLAASQAELNALIQPTLRKGLKETIVLSRWHDQITQGSRHALLLFLGAVGFLLLIACVNVANLMLSRAANRQKEMAVRLTVGAGRRRVIRQLLTESTLLALTGGLLGLVLAQWGKGLLISFISPDLPALHPIRLDYRVLLVTMAVAIATGVAFGLAPALQATRIPLNEVLKEAGRGTAETKSGALLRNLLLVCETALAMVLLIGSGLLYRSFLRARGIDLGFHSEQTLALTIDPTLAKYPTLKDQARFFEQVIESIKTLSGVQSVAGSSFPPLGNRTGALYGGIVEGRPEETLIVFFDAVTPDYFRILHIPLLSGRYFSNDDREGASGVAIVNQSFARHFFPNESCLGKRLHSWVHKKDMLTIVGVVGDASLKWESSPQPEIYVPYWQVGEPFMTLLVHTSGDPLHLVGAIRSQIARIDKDQPPHDIATLDEMRTKFLVPRRVNMLLLGAFAVLGLILAAVGVYGVVSYSVSRRTHEIGVRMALGAERGDVMRYVVWQGLRSVLIGTALGVAASLALTRFLKTLLFGVKPTDPVTFIAVAAMLAGVALLAAFVPARRATKVDPMVALRYE